MDDRLPLPAGQHQHQQEQCSRNQLHHIGGQSQAHGYLDAQLVEHTAQHHRRGALGGAQEAEGPGLPQSPGQLGAGVEVYDGHTDNHRRQAVHQLAGTHGGGEAAGFVADDAAAEGHQGVGDHQPQDLYCASVLGQGGHQGGVVAHSPQQQAGLRVEIGVQQQLDDDDQRQGHNQLPPGEGEIPKQGHHRGRGENGVRTPVDGQVGPGDLQVHREQGGHGDDARQQVPHLQLHVDQTGEKSRQTAHYQGGGQGQPGIDALGHQHRRDSGPQGKRAIHPQIRKVQNGIGDIHAVGDQGVDQPLDQSAGQQFHHIHEMRSLLVKRSDHGAAEGADALDGAFHRVAGLEESGRIEAHAHSRRGAGGDDGARQQRHSPGQLLQDLPDGGNQQSGIGLLPQLAVDPAGDLQRRGIGDLVGGDQHGAHGREAVQTLAEIPLLMARLQVPGGYVVKDGVAEDVVCRIGGFHVLIPSSLPSGAMVPRAVVAGRRARGSISRTRAR